MRRSTGIQNERSGGLLWSKQQHTTHEHHAEILVHYRFHPRCGERLTVIRLHRWNAEAEAGYIARDSSGILTYVPTWMCEPSAAQFTIQSQPRVSLPALLALRRLIDAVLSSLVTHEGGNEQCDSNGFSEHSKFKVKHR
jgi:hypothetical protein